MKDVKGSSNIEAVGHKDGVLTVKFKGGGTYEYADVPADLHDKMIAAESAGKFFHAHVKGKFNHKKQGEK